MPDTNQEMQLALVLNELIEKQNSLFKLQKEIEPLEKKQKGLKFSSPIISFANLQEVYDIEQVVSDKQVEVSSVLESTHKLIEKAKGLLPALALTHLEQKATSYLIVKRADNDFYAMFFFRKNYVAVWSNSSAGLADAVAKFRTEHSQPTPDFSMAGPFYR